MDFSSVTSNRLVPNMTTKKKILVKYDKILKRKIQTHGLSIHHTRILLDSVEEKVSRLRPDKQPVLCRRGGGGENTTLITICRFTGCRQFCQA